MILSSSNTPLMHWILNSYIQPNSSNTNTVNIHTMYALWRKSHEQCQFTENRNVTLGSRKKNDHVTDVKLFVNGGKKQHAYQKPESSETFLL